MDTNNSEDFYKSLVDNMYDGVYFVDTRRTITYWNKGAERIAGYTGEEVIGHQCWNNILRHIDDQNHKLCSDGCPLLEAMRDGREREVEVYLHHKAGYRVPIRVRVAPMYGPDGKIIGAVEIFSDNTTAMSAKQANDYLRQQAMLDPLTNIGNRRFIESRLHTRLEEVRRGGHTFGLLVLDIDLFKQINDTYGHSVGDDVLKMVAGTLSRTIRPMDAAARWGGDEFVVLVQSVTVEDLMSLTERIRFLVSQSFLHVNDQVINISTSIGATLAQCDDTIASLFGRADQFLYQSKAHGRDHVTIDTADEA